MPNAAPPATHEEVLAHYAALRGEHEAALSGLESRRARALQGLLAAVVVIGWLALGGLRASAQVWPLGVAFLAALALGWYALNRSPPIARLQRLIAYYDRSLRRVEGSERQSGRDGLDLRPVGHLYEHDLDLLGPESLFGLLCTVRTGPGERGLANLLLRPASHAETLERQEAVRELLPQTGLRERIALMGATRFQQIPASFFDEWLGEPAPEFAAVFRPVLAVTALLSVAMLLAGLLRVLPWSVLRMNLAAVLLLQGAICAYLRARVAPILAGGVKLQQPVKLFTEGLGQLTEATFTSPRLRELQRMARTPATGDAGAQGGGAPGAVKAMAQLESQLAVVEQRPKEYFLLLSLLLGAGTQAAISIARWKRRHAAAMAVWLAAWSEFEALNAVATYAYEHPEDAWPELLPAGAAPCYEAHALGHPLLAGAVRNDIALGDANRFYLISGSNMAGKSTLLRAIGMNAVLAYAGAPVRAERLRLTPLRLGASLALTDSLAEGKSKFKAEVERLAAIVQMGNGVTGNERMGQGDQDGWAVLFLVDEIFSGTNSHDRRVAAGAVLEALLARGAIGALSTHDLALTELADAASHGTNVHMASPDEADPLAFDYVLKPGVNRSSNALAIIRMMGLGVEA